MISNIKKCLVLDLDNTLWGGVIGEDGIDGIKLGLTSPGNSFIAFQQVILDLYNRGVILALNSKNNPEDAFHVFRNHPDMILKEHHFAAMRINWGSKDDNMHELAKELNLGLDSMVFLDDDPVNRALVRSMVPEVEVPEFPADPQEYARFLMALPYFNISVITDEDKMRGTFYVTERLRKEAEKQFATTEDFLRSLGLEIHCFLNDASCVPRLAQLTEKTNQFNTKKRPITETEMLDFIARPDYDVVYAHARDKFGDHGVIAFALVQKDREVWTIESLLMSCRVIGKRIEDALLETVASRARSAGARAIRIVFQPTERNLPAKEFIEKNFVDKMYDINRSRPMTTGLMVHLHAPA